jgi:Kef-type K+ transport system membrane component KefB/nucleotide-binding universal stress UspA family protein
MQLDPIVSFAILLAVILLVPPVFERLKLPGLVGLLVAGVILGPDSLAVLQADSETMKLLSDIGLVYLMFVAGLEIDLQQFQATKTRAISFGLFTFLVPLVTGTLIGSWFGFGWNTSILLGSLFASHTLLAYPILSRLGVVNNEAVTVTIGATIFTDIAALLVLAICIGIHHGDFDAFRLLALLLSLMIYSAAVLFGFRWLGQEFFRRSGGEEGNQFLFVLLVVFLSALGAQLIGVEKIVGAFLAGLAVNSVVGDGPVEEKVIFVGNVLFIPIFFVDLGLLIDLPAFVNSLNAIWLTLAIVAGLLASKFIASYLAKLLFHYRWRETLTMWSLSIPQVAATLAAALVGYNAGLLSEAILNSVIVLMLVTSAMGPLITARSAAGLVPLEPDEDEEDGLLTWEQPQAIAPLTVVVPVYNPKTERNLIEMASLLVKGHSGKIVPLAIAPANVHMDAPELDRAVWRSERLLAKATELARRFDVEAESVLRIDDNISLGISRASREQQASLIVIGWGRTTGLRARLFGNVIDSVLWASHCPVAVTRLFKPPSNIRHLLVPVENLSQPAVRIMRFAEILAAENQADVTLLHVCDRHASPERLAQTEEQLKALVEKCSPDSRARIQIIPGDDIAGEIIRVAEDYDLVVLRSLRRRLGIGELAISTVTTEVVKQLQCSVVVLGEPQRHHMGLLLSVTGDSSDVETPAMVNIGATPEP